MTEPRTGAPRDVPPPRPVVAEVPAEESPIGRAARAVADAVADAVAGFAGAAPGRSAAGGLRDVVGAVAGAVAGAFTGSAGQGSDAAAGAERTGRDPGALLGDLLAVTAPRLPVRDRARLRQAYPGASDDEIAAALVERAARATSGIGAATGGLSAAHWLAPPSLLAVPLELGAETVLVAAVEIVLIGELHELHGRRPPGDAAARAQAYLGSWSQQRAVGTQGAGLGPLLEAAGMRALRRRMTRKLAGSVPAAAPLLIGAALSGRGNRRATETLARRVLGDLRPPSA